MERERRRSRVAEHGLRFSQREYAVGCRHVFRPWGHSTNPARRRELSPGPERDAALRRWAIGCYQGAERRIALVLRNGTAARHRSIRCQTALEAPATDLPGNSSAGRECDRLDRRPPVLPT